MAAWTRSIGHGRTLSRSGKKAGQADALSILRASGNDERSREKQRNYPLLPRRNWSNVELANSHRSDQQLGDNSRSSDAFYLSGDTLVSSRGAVIRYAPRPVLLLIESRRYRFFDVYRDRVRLLERNFFAGVFAPKFESTDDWAVPLAQGLMYPRFSIGRLDAMTRRLRRNYGWMFLILLFAWFLKLSSALLQPEGTEADWRTPFINIVASAQLGPVTGWLVLIGVACFFGFLAWLAVRSIDESDDGEVHV